MGYGLTELAHGRKPLKSTKSIYKCALALSLNPNLIEVGNHFLKEKRLY
jgi:hypothetical protein